MAPKCTHRRTKWRFWVDLGGENVLLQNECIEGVNGIWRLVWVDGYGQAGYGWRVRQA